MSAGTFALSLFDDVFAKEITRVTGTLADLAQNIHTRTAAAKAQLPLLKLARFGNSKIPHTGSYRHDQNLLACSGIEGDYDGELISVDEAVERLLKANVTALVCTTPSHSSERPRWRVFAPFSAELPPQDRSRMVDRLNGALGGVLAPESWTLSQSYYYGCVEGNQDHRVEIIEGEFIDLLDELDLIAIGKPNGGTGNGNGANANGNARAGGPVDEAALADAIRTGVAYHESCTRLLGRWAQQGVPFMEAQERLLALFDEVDSALRDARWADRRADVPRTVEGIYGKDARKEDEADTEFAAIQADIGTLQHGDTAEVSRIIDRIAAAKLSAVVAGKLLTTIKEKSGSKIGDLKADLVKAEKALESAARKRTNVSRGDQWKWLLKTNDEGDPKPNMANVSITLRNAPEFRGALWLNEFTGQLTVRRPLFGESDEDTFRDRTWADEDELAVTEWMQDIAEINATRNTVFDGVNRVASENRFHPVRDYLDGVVWDGEPRIDNWLITYLGAKTKETDERYLKVAGARSLISAVARIYKPGIKSDTCLMVLGDQGIGKSTILRMLFDPIEQKWFTDEIAELGSKDASLQMRGIWCIELAELSALRAVELNRVKAFVTRTTDRFRPPYGRQVITIERQCVFVATSNDFEVLYDTTGNRRWLPFWAYCAKTQDLWADRHQLWAEAVHRFRQNEKFHIDEPQIIEIAKRVQKEHVERDVWEDPIAEYLENGYVKTKYVTLSEELKKTYTKKASVTISEILEYALDMTDKSKWTQSARIRIGRCLQNLGWDWKQQREDGERVRRYYPLPPPETRGQAQAKPAWALAQSEEQK